MSNQFSFTLEIEEAGWAYLRMVLKDRTLSIACSYMHDTLGDLVRAFAQLAVGPGSAEIACIEEPGDVLLRLRRSGDQMHVTVTRFSSPTDTASPARADAAYRRFDRRAWKKMLESRNKKAALRYEGPAAPIISSFVSAFATALDKIGQNHYVSRWGHPFPQEAWAALLANRPSD